MPDTVRLVVAVAFALAALAALYPLRFFRKPTAAEIDRRIEARQPAGAQSRLGAVRPAGRPPRRVSPTRCGANTRSAWPSSWRQCPATCRAPAFPSATLGRCAPWSRCSSSSPLPFPSARSAAACRTPFARRPAIDAVAAAHRRLGDAARLHRQGADLPHLQRQREHRRLHRAGRQRGRAARHRRRRRRDAELHRSVRQCPRHRAAAMRRSTKRKPAATAPADRLAPVRRQAHRRRHADAEVRRQRHPAAGPSR